MKTSNVMYKMKTSKQICENMTKKSQMNSGIGITIIEEKKNIDNKRYFWESIHSTQKQKMNYNPEQFITATEIKHYFESIYVVICYAVVWQHAATPPHNI